MKKGVNKVKQKKVPNRLLTGSVGIMVAENNKRKTDFY